MKRLLIILICSPTLIFATAFTSTTSGAWNATATWGGTGPPTATDTATIANGTAVTCSATCDILSIVIGTTTAATGSLTIASGGTFTTHCTSAPCLTLTGSSTSTGPTFEVQSGGTANLGSNTATSNTFDVVANNGTYFLEDNGATITFTGSVNWNSTSTVATKMTLNGHTICKPNGTGVSQVIGRSNNSGSAYNYDELDIVGASWASPAVFETVSGQANGGGCKAVATGGGNGPKLVVNYAIFNNCGDTTVDCMTGGNAGTTATTVNDFNLQNSLFNNSGRLTFNTNSGVLNTSTFLINAADFRNVKAGAGQIISIGSTNTTVPNPARLITNVTCDVEGTPTAAFPTTSITASNLTWGQSTLYPSNASSNAMGYVSYNCAFNSGTGINNKEENFWITTQNPNTTNNISGVNGATNNVWANSIWYTHYVNSHLYSTATVGTAANNYLEYNLADGDYWEPGDSGELCNTQGTYYCLNNLTVNSNVNLFGPIQNQTIYLDNNTVYNNNGGYQGEVSGAPALIAESYNNIFDHAGAARDPAAYPNCNSFDLFIYRYNVFEAMTGFNTDNNYYYGMFNSGDIGARTCTVNGLATGIVTGMYGGFSQNTGLTCGPSASPWCTSRASSAGVPLWSITPTSISGSPTTITYSTGGFTSGTTQNLVHVGDQVGDLNNFQYAKVATINGDTSITLDRTVVGWVPADKIGIGKPFWADNSYPLSAPNRGLNDVHAPANFVNPGPGVCDWYNIYVSSLTCPRQTEPTGTLGGNNTTIGHAAITVNGWDYGSGTSIPGVTYCTANCPQRVTPFAYTATDVLKWMGQQYRVMNGMLKNSGHNGQDVGAGWAPNYPPAMLGAQ